jgi:hypothetical protein
MEERVLVGGADSFMTVRHLRLRGRNHQIGAWLAEVAASKHGLTGSLLREVDPGHACGQAAYVMQHAPVLWERALGAAQGLELDPETCDSTSLPYNQLPPGLVGAACSLVAFPPSVTRSGHACLSRNFDFPKLTDVELSGIDLPEELRGALRPMLADPYLLELHPTDGGIPSLGMVNFDLLSGVLDGVNAEGIMVAVNADEIALREGRRLGPRGVGFHELACMRVVLDSCATVDEARQTLAGARHFVAKIPCHYLVADRKGEGFIFELDADGQARFLNLGTEPTAMTNHPLHRYPDRSAFPVPHDMASTGTSSFERFVRLGEELGRQAPPYDAGEMERICLAVSPSRVLEWSPPEAQSELANSPGFSRTLWHALYDALERSVRLRFYTGEETRGGGMFVESLSDPIAFTLS